MSKERRRNKKASADRDAAKAFIIQEIVIEAASSLFLIHIYKTAYKVQFVPQLKPELQDLF